MDDYRKLLESLTGSVPEQNGISGEDALEMMELARRLESINLDKLGEEKQERLTPMERLVEALKQNKDVKRKLSGERKRHSATCSGKCGGRCGASHYKTKRKKKREYDRTRYREVLKPQRKAELAEKLTTAEGWWEYLNRNWRWLKTPVAMTEEEWREVVWPTLNGRVPIFFRYDTRGPISLANIVVKDTETREVIYDGAEHTLRVQGHIL